MSSDLTNTKLVTIRTYGSSHVAHTAKALLSEHGIVAEVQGDELADALSWYGSAVRKIDLVTFERDVETAIEVLNQADLDAQQSNGPWSDGPTLWLCDDCDERNAHTFDQCWSCGAAKPENPRLVPSEVTADSPTSFDSEISVSPPIETDESPYRTPTSGTVVTKKSIELFEQRAIRAASVSVIIFPLGFYGLYLCLRCLSQGSSNWKVAAGVVVSLFCCLLTLFLFFGT